MPHIIVKLYSGRSEEEKKALSDKIVEATMEVLGSKERSISVAFEDIQPDDWEEAVYKPDIIAKEGTLYKKPGYTYE